jgi:Ti-type conjugative transfer relaxase TraA
VAIYHLHAKFIQRSAGGSSVAAAAYRSAERLVDQRTGLIHDFQMKVGVVHREILAPPDAPEWAFDRSDLWNAAEQAERRCDGQTGREVRVALPCELSLDDQVDLVRGFCRDHFTSRGLVVDVAIHHDNVDNPHAHIGLTTRPIGPEGFGKKDRTGHTKAALLAVREGWSLAVNNAMQRAGHAARVDHRSYTAQGIRLEPTCHIGMHRRLHERQERDVVAERLRHNDRVSDQNGEAIRQDPTIALDALTHHEAVFTRRKLAVWLHTHTLGTEQFQACLSGVMGHPEVVRVGTDAEGIEVFSTRRMLGSEREMLRLGGVLAQSAFVRPAPEGLVNTWARACHLSEEQVDALRHITQKDGDLVLLEGLAGTGKSTLFRAARQIWENQGHRVIGMALSGKAAEGLGESSGIADCRSLAAWEWAWDRQRDGLGRGDIVVVDEAGMVGTRQVERLLEYAQRVQAKVVLAGDSEQIQAVEAGCPFTELSKRHERAFLRGIRRQEQAWQRQATSHLARGDTASALDAYQAHGSVHASPRQAEACEALVARHAAYASAHPDKQQIALSVRRQDVAMLNAAIRAGREARGELQKGQSYVLRQGRLTIASGDRLCFLRNDRSLGVKNGTLGTVTEARSGHLDVRLDGPTDRKVRIDPNAYPDLAYGYALTVYKAQGLTVDQVHVLASRAFDSRSTYVAMTRHRQGMELYYGQDALRDMAAVKNVLARTRSKVLALSYDDAERQNRALQGRINATNVDRNLLSPAKMEELRRLASVRPLTLREAFEQSERGRRLVADCQFAIRNRDHWEDQAKRLRQLHPLAYRLGLLGRYQSADPITGRPMRLQVGRQRSEDAFRVFKTALQHAWRSPAGQTEARHTMHQHNRAVESAKNQLCAQQAQAVSSSQASGHRTAQTVIHRELPEMASKSQNFDYALRELPEMRAATQRLKAARKAVHQAQRGPNDRPATLGRSGLAPQTPIGGLARAAQELQLAKAAFNRVSRRPELQKQASTYLYEKRFKDETDQARAWDATRSSIREAKDFIESPEMPLKGHNRSNRPDLGR